MSLDLKKFKPSLKKNNNLELTTKLKQCEKERTNALHELDLLKHKNMNLENDMHNLFETNKVLESKVAKLQVELDKANATFKKLNAGSQVLDEILSSQKMSSDKGGLGYKVKESPKVGGKILFVKPNNSVLTPPMASQAKSPVKENNVKHARTKTPKAKMRHATVPKTTIKHGEVNAFKFKPFCHHCGLQGHIRPHCTKLHVTHNSYTHLGHSHGYDAHFIPTCHFCGMKCHIRPNCFKLHGCPTAPPQYYADNHGSKTQTPKCKVAPQPKDKNMTSRPMPKFLRKAEEVKTRCVWVKRSNLIPCANLPTNPLDDTGLSRGVDLAF
ncbi:hypothetical protein RHGRI_006869 [Rhododendron griersonianum]|uniref:CCHC-type domain-containing protein n=1 Tax=Rhododendron griersonianum TaxID=479676 RepID=A0AAV6KVH7_9ERIC|nr:hypothetical protein RHGRI_006869 [Rhododendron griersonianum]